VKRAANIVVLPPEQKFPSLRAAYLVNQGLTEAEVNPVFDMAATLSIRNMKAAVELLRDTLGRGESVGLVGDYDVDGISGTAGPYLAFKEAGLKCKVHIPNRDLGFGLQVDAVEKMHAAGVKLIVCIDNGTAAKEAVARAKELGMNVLVLDHHPAPDWNNVAGADVIVNVSHPDSDPQYMMMSGAAVAYAFLYNCVREGVIKLDDVERYSAFAAFGIIADVVDLRGINRPIVSQGLARCREFVGFDALCALSKWIGDVPKAQEVAFQLAPRLNAAGRLGDARDAFRLLVTQNRVEAKEMATALDRLNLDRQTKVSLAMREADKMVEALDESWETITLWGPTSDEYSEPDAKTGERTLLRAGWTHGIVGLIAGKIAERYARPTFIGSVEEAVVGEDGVAVAGVVRGSARTGGGVPCGPLLGAAEALAKEGGDKEALFVRYGGHDDAAGFTTTEGRMVAVAGALHHAAKDYLSTKVAQRKGQVIKVDAVWPLPLQSELGELQSLEPTGQGLRPAMITSKDVKIAKYNWTGKVLRLSVIDERLPSPREVMAFREMPLSEGDTVDLTYEVSSDGSLMVRDIANVRALEQPVDELLTATF
jgi:single-stranded-DNA-specific exonuclease